MIHRVYSVFDDKADFFLPPFFQTTEGQARRVFSDAVKQKDHPFALNPHDFHLYHLGEYDDMVGMITSLDKPKLLVSAKEIANQENADG